MSSGRRILVVGSREWSSVRLTTAALRRVMDVYRGPYTLVAEDDADGAPRHAAAMAERMGWTVERFKVDPSCTPECAHAKRPVGSRFRYECKTALGRAIEAQLAEVPDLCLVLARVASDDAYVRYGQGDAHKYGIAVWIYKQRGELSR